MGRFDESLATYEEVRPLIEGLQIPYLTTEVTEGLALTRLGLGQGEEAASLCAQRRAKAGRARHRPCRAARGRAGADRARARRHWRRALKQLDVAWKHLEAGG